MSESKFDEERSVTVVMTSQVFEVPDSDIEVLLEMAGYGINYWARELDYNMRAVHVVDQEEGGYEGVTDTYATNYTALAQALVDIGTGKVDSGYSEYARLYLSELSDTEEAEYAAGHIDSDLADHVVQIALFGEIIYG